MTSQDKIAVVLMNLGTPESPEPAAVARFLREFLMDPLVIDRPWPVRWVLVNALIVPGRKKMVSGLYKSIWTEQGSPLLVYLRGLRDQVAANLEGRPWDVFMAMRYGQPSVESVIKEIMPKGYKHVIFFPLYPQFAESSTLSSREEVVRQAKYSGLRNFSFVPPFFKAPAFVTPMAKRLTTALNKDQPNHVLMSFHGLPEAHMRKTDRSSKRSHCLREGCCESISDANRDCYRAQCWQTAKALAKACGLTPDRYTVCFQSRLGRAEWIKPYTDLVITDLAKKGVKSLLVICPAFVADALETLEEIHIRGAESFKSAGGSEFATVPCLNADPDWADSVIQLVEAKLPELNR